MTDTANLEDGFFWVRYRGGEWTRAKKLTNHAEAPGAFVWEIDGDLHPSNLFDEIDPRPIKREE